MDDERIQYCGRYLYPATEDLERALVRAKSLLVSDDGATDSPRLRVFVETTTLTVNLCVPSRPEHRFIAANLFLVLAHGATQGSFRKLDDKRWISVEHLTPFRVANRGATTKVTATIERACLAQRPVVQGPGKARPTSPVREKDPCEIAPLRCRN